MAIRTVLIADSNARLAQLLAQLLADEPEFSVLEVCSSADVAVRRACEQQPDVVLVSERLSGRAGADVCRDLRGCLPDATLLLWSHDTSRAAPGGEQCADGLLERGLTFRELARAVRRTRHEASGTAGIPVVRGGEREALRGAVATGAPTAAGEVPADTVPADTVPADTVPADTGQMLLACDSCAVELSVATRDMSSAVEKARAFFTEHADCETSIDLTRHGDGRSKTRAAGPRQSAGC